MEKAAIISIGNELLNGQTTDTNSSWLSGRLFEMGIPTVGGWTVPDETGRIVEALKAVGEKADIVLVTGGLGPTDDDITRQAVADYLGVKLQFHPAILEQLEDFFKKRGRAMVETNRCQADIPSGCEVLDNPIGTAPGFCVNKDNVFIAVMPGVPAEMKRMFDEQVTPHIQKNHTGSVVAMEKLRCFGPGESTVAQKLGNLMDRSRNPLINCTCGSGQILLHIVAQAKDHNTAAAMIEKDKKMLSPLLGDWVYGYNDDTLAAVVGNLLRKSKKTIATAESCTGGLVAKLLTDVPGSSDYMSAGWVTYNNDVKISQLGVSQQLIIENGAVSEPVARAMAVGAAQKSGADVAIGITGIAGPGGGTDEKPAGLVYIGVCMGKQCFVEECRFPATNRDFVRYRSALTALNLVRLKLRI